MIRMILKKIRPGLLRHRQATDRDVRQAVREVEQCDD